MSATTIVTSNRDAARHALADMTEIYSAGLSLKADVVVAVIDNFCIYARCTRFAMPDQLAYLYKKALAQPSRIFTRKELSDRLVEMAAA